MKIELTEKESAVLRKLHEQVKKITGGKKPTVNLVKAIVASCSSWNFPIIFEHEDPKEISDACKSLLKMGLVKEFSDNGLPSFIPVSEIYVVEYKCREFTQADVW